MSEFGDMIRHHHGELSETLRAHLRIADRGASPAEAHAFLAFLKQELLPHAAGEERAFYPALDEILRSHGGPTRTMRLDHRRIVRYVGRLDRVARRMLRRGNRQAGGATFRDLSRELGVLLALHFEKEESVYLPLFERSLSEGAQRGVLERMHGTPVPVTRPRTRTRGRVRRAPGTRASPRPPR